MTWIRAGLPLLGLLSLVACNHTQQQAEQAAASPQAQQPLTVEPRADQLLRQMSRFLGGQQQFQVTSDSSLEVVKTGGGKTQYEASSRVAVQRPDKLRSERSGALAELLFIYDGRSFYLFGPEKNLYATREAPANLDQAIDAARAQLGLEVPGADLLFSDPYPGLAEDLTAGRYLGLESVGGQSCHHLAFTKPEVDFQLWVADGEQPLPCKYLIVSKQLPEAPEFSVTLRDWELAPSFPAGTFEIKPPEGAQKIEFLPPPPEAQNQR